MSASARPRLAAAAWRRPGLRAAALLAPPLGWLGVVYLGSLAVLLVASFWTLDEFSGLLVKGFSLDNFKTIVDQSVYRTIVLRTVSIAALVTITDVVLAFPIAMFMAWVARPRAKALLVAGVLMPLWASYLIKVYAWRTMFAHDGVVNWLLKPFSATVPQSGFTRVWLVLAYLWLPYMILPIYAGLERLPRSLLDASGDLGAHPWRTFRSVVLPMTLPAVAAGSIFTFSLSLGDYITPQLMSSTQFIGNVVYANVGIADNLPLAAAFATVPVLIVSVYLVLVKRAGAFEAL
ncbi:MAG: ABC transporter permease [Thermoleophilaceae bacterium]